ncbi:hypothetical protein TESG_01345 [Trichophyton tonsurans CBS 112818]|uniref:Uncharacterized protein n=1 Tax=Trichophyton tonsurans (strain CBS 112818) TaxID=647933 RepID=F2RR63_TRIT1|nr:hypothetical protein TESG_01345 [Trichophyton tonsurans CBS 112818]
MGGCCMNCDPFRCFRRNEEPDSEEEVHITVSDDSTKVDSTDSSDSLVPQLPPINRLSNLHIPGVQPPSPDPLHATLFSEEPITTSFAEMVYYYNGSAGLPQSDLNALNRCHAAALSRGSPHACQDPTLRSQSAIMGPRIIDRAPGISCDLLTEAMQAMADELKEEQASAKTLENTAQSQAKNEDGCQRALVPDVVAEAREIASRIVVPDPEAAEEKDGSRVAFTVNIKPPPRPLPLNWKPSQVVERVCKGMDAMIEIRAGINSILRDKPDYIVGLPYTTQHKKELELRALGTVIRFAHCVAEDKRLHDEKEPIRVLVTCFEILVQCTSASLAAALMAVEDSKSPEEDEAIRLQVQRWLVQTFSDIWVLERETAGYLARFAIGIDTRSSA